jgi:hypothetical protein
MAGIQTADQQTEQQAQGAAGNRVPFHGNILA